MDRNSLVVVCDSYYLSVNTGQSADSSSRCPSPNRSLKGFNLFRVISQKLGRGIRKSKEDKCTTSSDDDEDSNSSTNSIPRVKNQVQNRKDNMRCDCDYFYKSQNEEVTSEKNLPEKEKSGVHIIENMGTGEYRKKCLKISTPCRHHHSSGSDTCSSNDDSSESNDTDQKTSNSNFSSNDSSASSSSGGSYKQSTTALRKGLKNLNINSKSLSCFSISQIKDVKDRRDSGSKEQKPKKNPQKILRQPPTHTYVRGISGLPTLRVINSRENYNSQYSRGNDVAEVKAFSGPLSQSNRLVLGTVFKISRNYSLKEFSSVFRAL